MQKHSSFRLSQSALALLLQSILVLTACDAKADEPTDKREYQTASIKLQTTLQKNPQDKEARQQLGLLNLEWGNWPLAEKELRRAIELGGPQETLQFSLAEALLMQGKYQEVLDYLAPMALMSAQDQAMLLAYRGDAWQGLNQPEKARTEYETALHMEANSPLALLGLARLALADNRAEEAQKRVTEVLALAPNEPKAWSLQGALFESSKQMEKAEESYSKAIGLKHFSPIELASRAIVRINRDKLKEAQEDFNVLRKQAPNFFLTEYAAGILDVKLGKYAEAQTSLEKALKMNDRFAAINYYLGIAHLYQNHDHEAEQYLAAFMKAQPQAVEPRLFLAQAKFNRKDREAARNLLLPLLEKQPDNEYALKLMSDIEFAEGNHGKGFQYLDKLAKLPKPSDKAAGGMEAMPNEDKNKVLAYLETAKEVDAKLARQLTTIVLGQIAAKDFGHAEELIDKIGKKAPGNPLADNLLGLMRLGQNAPDQARASFEAALEKSPGNPAIIHELAQLAVREGKPEAARRLYEKALRTYPKDMPTRLHLAELDGLEAKPKAMEERLSGVIKDYPTALQPRMMLANYFLNTGDPGRAQSLLQDLQQGYADNASFMVLLIHTQLENHDSNKAMASAKVFVQLAPSSPMSHYLLASAYAELRDTANSRKELEQAIALDTKFLPARYSLVKLLATEKKMPEANAALEALAKQYPDSVETLALQGWLATEQGKPAQAVAAYRSAFEKSPGAKTVTDLARAEWRAGDKENGAKTLEDWIQRHPDDAPAHLLAAEFYVAQHQDGAAIQHLEAILKTHPENALVMNNLAWLYRSTAPEKALEMAQGAAAIAPKSPNVLDTLAMIELGQGQTAKSVKLLKRAVEFAPQYKPAQYHLAIAMDKANQPADARRILQDLLADPRPFPDQQDAKALFDKLSAH